MNGENGNPSGMTTKEWLQRIEHSLVRIEDKLDSKANIETVVALESRLRLLESLGSEQSRAAEREVREVSARLGEAREEFSGQLSSLKVKVYAVFATVALLATVAEVIRQGVNLGG